ncbi:MAG: hypothetical protein R3E31_11410 [Chloroflexota bacterium]
MRFRISIAATRGCRAQCAGLGGARQAQAWPTSHETAWSILALTDRMRVTGELEANYDYSLAVNLEMEVQGEFTPANVTNSELTSIPVSDLAANEVNFSTSAAARETAVSTTRSI